MARQHKKWPHYPAARNAGIALGLAIKTHCPGFPTPLVSQPSITMRVVAFLVLLASSACAFAADTNLLAVGDWSAPVTSEGIGPDRGGTLRGRLLLAESPKPSAPRNWHDSAVYLELQECGESWGGVIDVYCNMIDASACRWELRDSSGKAVPESPGGFGGGTPGRDWITMPSDSTVRLRATVYGGGKGEDGRLHIMFLSHNWEIPPRNTNSYFLSGTFTVVPARNHVVVPEHRVWQGTLTLPAVKIPVLRP